MEILAASALFLLSILALMATQARALTVINEMQYRMEALHFANGYAAKMWGTRSDTHGLYEEGQEEYEKFENRIKADTVSDAPGLPGARSPTITVTPAAGGGTHVLITISWHPPGSETVQSHTQESFISN